MGKTSKWLKSLLTGKREKEKSKEKRDNNNDNNSQSVYTVPVPKEKRRWSFRRPANTGKELNLPDQSLASTSAHGFLETRVDPERHAMAVAVATAAAADAAVAAAQAAAAMIRLTMSSNSGTEKTVRRRNSMVKEVAAIKIQSVFRSYLARKALCALRGLVKLQALVRGHLVRKQATNTLLCMQALVTVQARARLQRLQMLHEETEGERNGTPQRQRSVRRSPQHPRFRQSHDSGEENVKIVEIDVGVGTPSRPSTSKGRHSYSPTTPNSNSKTNKTLIDTHSKVSPTPSALTDLSPRTYSGHFDDFSFTTAQSAATTDYNLFPNYMANTESSRAKARSQSAPKMRPPELFERQGSARRRASLEGRNVPRGIKMQRSSSQAGSTVSGYGNQYPYPWSVKLDKSNVSLKDSECGSTSTVLTNASYYRYLLAYEVHGKR